MGPAPSPHLSRAPHLHRPDGLAAGVSSGGCSLGHTGEAEGSCASLGLLPGVTRCRLSIYISQMARKPITLWHLSPFCIQYPCSNPYVTHLLRWIFLKTDYLRVATYSISTFKAHGFLGTFQCGPQIPVKITELIRERALGSHWGCGRELELFLVCLLGGVGNLGTFFHQH